MLLNYLYHLTYILCTVAFLDNDSYNHISRLVAIFLEALSTKPVV